MSRPTSPEELCNLAFDLLRHTTSISNITTPLSDEESLANRWYDAIRTAVLGAYIWEFAKGRTKVLLDPTYVPISEFKDAYILPVDYVGLIFIGEDIDDDYETDYDINGRHILINYNAAATLPICYIKDFTEVARFDPVFIPLLIGELAVVFGNSITGLNKGIKTAEAFRDRWEVKARIKNGRNTPVNSRYSGIISGRVVQALGRLSSSDGIHLF